MGPRHKSNSTLILPEYCIIPSPFTSTDRNMFRSIVSAFFKARKKNHISCAAGQVLGTVHEMRSWSSSRWSIFLRPLFSPFKSKLSLFSAPKRFQSLATLWSHSSFDSPPAMFDCWEYYYRATVIILQEGSTGRRLSVSPWREGEYRRSNSGSIESS